MQLYSYLNMTGNTAVIRELTMKRYTEAQKKSIIAKVDGAPAGKQMATLKKLGVSYGTLHKWRGRRGVESKGKPKPAIGKGVIKELFNIRNRLNKLLSKV